MKLCRGAKTHRTAVGEMDTGCLCVLTNPDSPDEIDKDPVFVQRRRETRADQRFPRRGIARQVHPRFI